MFSEENDIQEDVKNDGKTNLTGETPNGFQVPNPYEGRRG
jgi:hypothetical protein